MTWVVPQIQRELLKTLTLLGTDGVREGQFVVTIVSSGCSPEKVIVGQSGQGLMSLRDKRIQGYVREVLGEVGESMRGGGTKLAEVVDEAGVRVKVIIEDVRSKQSLVIFGAGHVGQALALMGVMLGYKTTVVDDRPEFLSCSRLPDARIETLASGFEGVVSKVEIQPNTAIVIVTRGHQHDEMCLRDAVRSSASYIGMIGSKRRVLSVFGKLAQEGYTQAELSRVNAPIGLSIGARSPQEIAVAILAEIISHWNS